MNTKGFIDFTQAIKTDYQNHRLCTQNLGVTCLTIKTVIITLKYTSNILLNPE